MRLMTITSSWASRARMCGLFLMPATLVAKAEVVDRRAGELADEFALRVGPSGATLAHPSVETDEWHLGGKVVLAFYGVEVHDQSSSAKRDVIEGVAFMPTAAAGRYRRIAIGRIDEEGEGPDIKSIFFANADQNPDRELVVIVGWKQQHLDISGTLYGTFIYARPRAASQSSFTLLEETSRKVSGGCECDREGDQHESSDFKTAADVRAGLKALGFR